MLSDQQFKDFVKHGFIVLPKLIEQQTLAELRSVTHDHLASAIQPYELEAEVNYPGAPSSTSAKGGHTIRRLLQAYSRHDCFKEQAEQSIVTSSIKQLLKTDSLFINPNHHNCIMTKQPQYSSQTNWHRDTRYWHFNNKYLINAWFALGDESADNGGMLILPGSHRWDVEEECLDEKQFLIEDHPKNSSRLLLAEQVNLNAGDCLLFSAHCFHAAGKNLTKEDKYSLAFTYHGKNTWPLENTKSDRQASFEI